MDDSSRVDTSGEQSDKAREADIAHTLIRLADTLVTAADEIEVLRDLVDSSVRILDVDTAGVVLASSGRLEFVAGTSEDMAIIELVQSQNQQGPCLDAYETSAVVHTSDLQSDRHRWPLWAPRALDLGFRSIDAFPMRLRDSTIGALNVYAKRERTLSERDAVIGQALADIATIGVLHERGSARDAVVQQQLQHALDSRVVIEQAKGVLAGETGIDLDTAFETLRAHARRRQATLRSVADAVVRLGLRPPPPGS